MHVGAVSIIKAGIERNVSRTRRAYRQTLARSSSTDAEDEVEEVEEASGLGLSADGAVSGSGWVWLVVCGEVVDCEGVFASPTALEEPNEAVPITGVLSVERSEVEPSASPVFPSARIARIRHAAW